MRECNRDFIKRRASATARAILDLIERYRERGLTSPINADVLARAGIPTSLIPRTVQALQTLDLRP